jgi:hypothetical protein
LRNFSTSCRENCQGLDRNHKKKHWESLKGLKQAKRFIQGPSARRTKEVLKWNRNQLRWMVWLFTGHCHLKGHLFKMGLTVLFVKGT